MPLTFGRIRSLKCDFLCSFLIENQFATHGFASLNLRYYSNTKKPDLLDAYVQKVESKELRFDARQKDLIEAMLELNKKLEVYEKEFLDHSSCSNKGGFFSIFSKISAKEKELNPPRGMYIYGSVGTGKTMLMDMFLEHNSLQFKRRSHFNSFMNNFHRTLFQILNSEEFQRQSQMVAIDVIASRILENTPLICLDEFQVTNTADAMIIGRLFDKLWNKGAVLIATSNRNPDDLYKDGLQRDNFLPFIEELKRRCEIYNINSQLDYRSYGEKASRAFINKKVDSTMMDSIWNELTGNRLGEYVELKVHKTRTLQIRCAINGIARFGFAELCQVPMDSADYACIASNFHTVLIEDVPLMDMNSLNSLRRFITLVDELYEHRVKIFLSAHGELKEIFTEKIVDPSVSRAGEEEIFAFSRTLSRLSEMQTKDYLSKPHIGN